VLDFELEHDTTRHDIVFLTLDMSTDSKFDFVQISFHVVYFMARSTKANTPNGQYLGGSSCFP